VRTLLVVLLALAGSPVAAAWAGGGIATDGARLSVPAGWHAAVARTPRCDPERLVAVSSGPLHIDAGGALAPPQAGQVLILLLEDRLRVDRPVGDLRRPAHFRVTWNRLTRLKGGGCGEPSVPAFMRWFRVKGRYLGYIVYPGSAPGARTKSQALTVLDSLRVRA
jgi:hypothetical protein